MGRSIVAPFSTLITTRDKQMTARMDELCSDWTVEAVWSGNNVNSLCWSKRVGNCGQKSIAFGEIMLAGIAA